jgi:hypothetical protein
MSDGDAGDYEVAKGDTVPGESNEEVFDERYWIDERELDDYMQLVVRV